MYSPTPPTVTVKPLAKAGAVPLAAHQSNVLAPSLPSSMPRREQADNVPASSLPSVIRPPPTRQGTQVLQRTSTPKQVVTLSPFPAMTTEVITLPASPAMMPSPVKQNERFDSVMSESRTTAGSNVVPVMYQTTQANVATRPASSATQAKVPSSQPSMSDLRPQLGRETRALELFVTSDAVPDSGAYIELETLLDKRYPFTGGSLERLSWNKFLRSLPPGFCPDIGSMRVLVGQPSYRERHTVCDCKSLSYAIGDERHHRPRSQQIAVHIACSKS